jgi:DNA-binding IclR family transcriptional regulator
MQDLSDDTGETICLSTHDGLFTRFIRFIDPTEPIGLRIAIGQQSPIINSAVGRAFLATCSEEDIKKLFTNAARLNKPSRPTFTLKELMIEIDTVRAEKISISYGEVAQDMGAIAAPLQKSSDQTAFVLSVAGPKDRIQSKEKMIVRSIKKAINRHVTAGVNG